MPKEYFNFETIFATMDFCNESTMCTECPAWGIDNAYCDAVKIMDKDLLVSLVKHVKKLQDDKHKITNLLARAYLFADWKSVEVEKILDENEKRLKLKEEKERETP